MINIKCDLMHEYTILQRRDLSHKNTDLKQFGLFVNPVFSNSIKHPANERKTNK